MCTSNTAYEVCCVPVESYAASKKKAIGWCLLVRATILYELFKHNLLPSDVQRPDFDNFVLEYLRPLCHMGPFQATAVDATIRFQKVVLTQFREKVRHTARKWVIDNRVVQLRNGIHVWSPEITGTWFQTVDTVQAWLRTLGKRNTRDVDARFPPVLAAPVPNSLATTFIVGSTARSVDPWLLATTPTSIIKPIPAPGAAPIQALTSIPVPETPATTPATTSVPSSALSSLSSLSSALPPSPMPAQAPRWPNVNLDTAITSPGADPGLHADARLSSTSSSPYLQPPTSSPTTGGGSAALAALAASVATEIIPAWQRLDPLASNLSSSASPTSASAVSPAVLPNGAQTSGPDFPDLQAASDVSWAGHTLNATVASDSSHAQPPPPPFPDAAAVPAASIGHKDDCNNTVVANSTVVSENTLVQSYPTYLNLGQQNDCNSTVVSATTVVPIHTYAPRSVVMPGQSNDDDCNSTVVANTTVISSNTRAPRSVVMSGVHDGDCNSTVVSSSDRIPVPAHETMKPVVSYEESLVGHIRLALDWQLDARRSVIEADQLFKRLMLTGSL
ncbi:hypothetical protein HER10_EVM0007973 [Colletotrichum scovillei]|uniref:uncharacterized protein n=1 Tax=Colletotrichum scovillei TaxID=1209932 RepID=UPI0015C35BEB|nr:uncharacterized protein HER10_EVM0007973 [Colletotrichum scovillei]KAF4772812.1 hypothetical protein HER10_EVM0007973 [Colletotrichum scovillei]KAG7038491.1 hypothetical protein JMJ78_0000882 [Colletotrichum scovillei]